MAPGVEAWNAWDPGTVAGRLRDIDVPWCVAAGWAADLFRGGQSRAHEDLEIAVPASGFTEIAERLSDCDFHVVGDGQCLPVTAGNLERYHQTWALERATGRWRVDVFREPGDGDMWICRRDPRIRRPYAEIIEHTSDGIPYLAPEVVLLFKAKADRDKDRADLAGVWPLLDEDRRSWLRHALGLVHPGHSWLSLL